ncbi:uncharacterized protein LOC114359746, partial [Ostrinia furnacalis]|uniref:uncharacterized protein LOC114359746 n=1 Tax=Ostrinia furnacalis TaxID=93504 RepID=UPI001039E18D
LNKNFKRFQEASLWVDVAPTTDEVEVERRYTPELETELQSAKDDALLLYTEFTARSGLELKMFLKEMTGFADKSLRTMDAGILANAKDTLSKVFANGSTFRLA